MVRKLLLLALALVASVAVGQNFYSDRAFSINPLTGGFGPISNGPVRVCSLPASGSPCTPTATITDIFGNPLTVVGGNFGQLTTDIQGRFNFGCAAGNYEIQVTTAGNNTPFAQYLITCGGASTGTFTQIAGTANQISSSNPFGPITTLALTNPLNIGVLNATGTITAPSFVANSASAGAIFLGQGTVASLGTTAVGLVAGTTGVVSYNLVMPVVSGNGSLTFSTSVNQTGCVASATNLCGSFSAGTTPTLALPPSPLVNQGVGVTSVYAQGVVYHTTAENWSESQTATLTGGSASSLTLAVGHVGVDVGSGFGYQVFINDGANSEAVNVTGGTYTSGAGGTILFTPFFSHGPSAYTVGSASSGIQETINLACGTSSSFNLNYFCNVIVPANGPGNPHSLNIYTVNGTIYLHTAEMTLSGYGVSLDCVGRGPCINIGSGGSDGNTAKINNSSRFPGITIKGFTFRTPTNFSAVSSYAGVAISNVSKTTQVVTVTTANPHNFHPGDLICQLFTDNSRYWGDKVVATVPDANHYTYSDVGADISSASTPGVTALAYEAFLDGQTGTHFIDIQYDNLGNIGHFNQFFDFWDDEGVTIDHFNNNAINLNNSATWNGSFIFSGGNPFAAFQWAPVISLRDANITGNFSSGITVYNSNAVYIENSVLQSTGLWQVYISNLTGNFQGFEIHNLYSESSAGQNPASPAHTPYPGAGVGGLVDVNRTGADTDKILGPGPFGAFPVLGAGVTNHFHYFIVAHDTTAATVTAPMEVEQWNSTGVDSPLVSWPRIANNADTITYDIIRQDIASVTAGTVYPYNGGCTGGSVSACGSVTTALTQAAACGNTLVCTFTDNPAANTSSYAIATGNYVGAITFWPGSIVTQTKSILVDQDVGPVVGIALQSNPAQVATNCTGSGATAPQAHTLCLGSYAPPNNSINNQSATLLADATTSGSGETQTKGRLNFTTSPSATIAAHHIITLVDNNPALTKATLGFRPPADPNDTWIGQDAGTSFATAQLAFGSPIAISNYIGNVGDNSAFGERLTSTLKTFKVPLNIGANYIDIVEQAAPANPAANTNRVYANSTIHQIQCLTSSGGSCFAASGLWSGLGNAAADLTLSNAGFNTTFNQTSATNWKWINTTAATNVLSQSSPIFTWGGQFWNGAASAADNWTAQNVVANGTNGTSTLTFAHSGTTGVSLLGAPGFNVTGTQGAVAGFGIGATSANNLTLFGSASGANILQVLNGATAVFAVTHPSGILISAANNEPYVWSSTSSATGAADTGISRQAANMVSIGNGAQADETGLLRSGDACRVTADITLPVNTTTTVCTWSLPAVAKAWAWQCQIPWVISAGSGTNTLAIIANPSQTPTGATNGAAEIKTTNTNTATEAVTAISASGATTLLTSGTITPAATVFMSSTSGTLLASGTAGTFAIQMNAAGTTATAAAKAGATCVLY